MKQYQLNPSPSLLIFTIALYLLACLGLLLYFNLTALSVLTVVLILLLLYSEIRKFIEIRKRNPVLISLRLSTGEIEWVAKDNSQLFTRYSVYNSRWGMVLKLKSRWARNNLILLTDRFQHKNEYLDLRYQLIHLKQVMNVS